MILIKLEGQEQVTGYWNIVKDTISSSLSNKVPERLFSYYLDSLLTGKMQVWVGLPNADSTVPMCCLVTAENYDPVVGAWTLLVCFAKKFSRMEMEDWIDGKEALVNFALARNCITVTGYLERDSFINALVEKLGATAHYTLVSMRVTKQSTMTPNLNGVMRNVASV